MSLDLFVSHLQRSMASKEVPAHSLPSQEKRVIKGPSQALRSPSSAQTMGRIQAFVSSLASDPEALARFTSDVDGIIQRSTPQSSAQAGPSEMAGASSQNSSLSADEGEGFQPSGVLFSDSQFSRIPVSSFRAGVRGAGRPARRAARGRGPRATYSRTAVLPRPQVTGALGADLSHSSVSAVPGPSRQEPESDRQEPELESSAEDNASVQLQVPSSGQRRPEGHGKKRAKKNRADASGSSAALAPGVARVTGNFQQDSGSESSAEDTLPAPSRVSSGGKRRHKKCCGGHAKRCRGNRSSSSSGSSSSSSDGESGDSLRLYWGFGESASGLPRWAWQRRANSHRAKYGATQEYLNDVPVPEVKVSTNKARDIIPGSHLSSKLRNRILEGRYVDIFKPAPPEEDLPGQDKVASSSKKRASSAKVEKTFERWLDCFQVFAGVIAAAYPKRALHLIVYQSIVRMVFSMWKLQQPLMIKNLELGLIRSTQPVGITGIWMYGPLMWPLTR